MRKAKRGVVVIKEEDKEEQRGWKEMGRRMRKSKERGGGNERGG